MSSTPQPDCPNETDSGGCPPIHSRTVFALCDMGPRSNAPRRLPGGIRPTLAPSRRVDLEAGDPWTGRSGVLSIVLSIEPGRSRHLGIAKAANRAIHLGVSGILS